VIAEAEPKTKPAARYGPDQTSVPPKKKGTRSFVPFAVSGPYLHLGEDNLLFALKLVQNALGDDLQMGVVADAFHQRRHRGLEIDQQIRRRQGFDDQVVQLAVGPIVSQAEHLHIVQGTGEDVSILINAAILNHRVLAGTDGQMGAGRHPRQ
jgi:hypothetical protein